MACLIVGTAVPLLVSVLFIHAGDCASNSWDGQDDSLYQEAEHHIRGLANVLQRLDSSTTSSSSSLSSSSSSSSSPLFRRRYKRNIGNDDVTFDAFTTLGDICSRVDLEALAGNTKTVDEGVEESHSDRLIKLYKADFNDKDHPDKWKLPELFIASVKAERQRDDVNLNNNNKTLFTFNITHSSQAFVVGFYFWSDNEVKQTIGSADSREYKGRSITSTVRISADSTDCPHHTLADLAFGLVGDKSFTIRTGVDLCVLHKLGESRSGADGRGHAGVDANTKWVEVGEDEVTQNLPIPEFRLVGLPSPSSASSASPNNNEILITGEKNTTQFLVDVFYPSHRRQFQLNYRLWDWGKEEMERGNIQVDNWRDEDSEVFDYQEIVSYSIVHRTVLNGTMGKTDDGIEPSVAMRILIAVNTGSKKMSGKLELSYDRYGADFTPKVLWTVTTKAEIRLRLPYKMLELPDDLIQLHAASETFKCSNSNGDENKKKKPCTLQCFAEGTNIKSISIAKGAPYIPPVKSISNVLNGVEAYAQIDMGPASQDIDGAYRCIAVTENGRVETINMTLVSYGFPIIRSINITDFQNGTTRIECEAWGLGNLRVALRPRDERSPRGNFHNNENTSLEKIDNQTILITTLVNTNRLLFPTQYVECKGSNERGEDDRTVHLAPYIAHYNYSAPIVLKDEFRVRELQNGTSRITCTATGGEDVRISIEAVGPNGSGGRFVVANKRKAVQWIEKNKDHDDRKTVVVDIPSQFLPRLDLDSSSSQYVDIFCLAYTARGRTSTRIDKDNILRREEME